MNGLEIILKNLRVYADEVEAVQARASRVGIGLRIMSDQIERALKRKVVEQSGIADEVGRGCL